MRNSGSVLLFSEAPGLLNGGPGREPSFHTCFFSLPWDFFPSPLPLLFPLQCSLPVSDKGILSKERPRSGSLSRAGVMLNLSVGRPGASGVRSAEVNGITVKEQALESGHGTPEGGHWVRFVLYVFAAFGTVPGTQRGLDARCTEAKSEQRAAGTAAHPEELWECEPRPPTPPTPCRVRGGVAQVLCSPLPGVGKGQPLLVVGRGRWAKEHVAERGQVGRDVLRSTSTEESGRGRLREKYSVKIAGAQVLLCHTPTRTPTHARRGRHRDKGTCTACVGGGCP